MKGLMKGLHVLQGPLRNVEQGKPTYTYLYLYSWGIAYSWVRNGGPAICFWVSTRPNTTTVFLFWKTVSRTALRLAKYKESRSRWPTSPNTCLLEVLSAAKNCSLRAWLRSSISDSNGLSAEQRIVRLWRSCSGVAIWTGGRRLEGNDDWLVCFFDVDVCVECCWSAVLSSIEKALAFSTCCRLDSQSLYLCID